MTVAQTKSVRRRMKLRYGGGIRYGWSIADAVEKERQRAERERARQASKNKAKK